MRRCGHTNYASRNQRSDGGMISRSFALRPGVLAKATAVAAHVSDHPGIDVPCSLRGWWYHDNDDPRRYQPADQFRYVSVYLKRLSAC